MRDLLPESVRLAIRDRYVAGVADAEATFVQHAADEDALTGALGQAIAMPSAAGFDTWYGAFVVEISYRKLRGRSRSAPEKRYGADGVFQIEVRDQQGNVVRRKGLPFQSKKAWGGRNTRLAKQVSDMQRELGDGIVVDFAPTGYKAFSVHAVIENEGDKRRLLNARADRNLGQLLGNDFLDCNIGIRDLYFDTDGERFVVEHPAFHVITTSVRSLW